jgi:hypothetical protein
MTPFAGRDCERCHDWCEFRCIHLSIILGCAFEVSVTAREDN